MNWVWINRSPSNQMNLFWIGMRSFFIRFRFGDANIICMCAYKVLTSE